MDKNFNTSEAWHTSKFYVAPSETEKLKNKMSVKLGKDADTQYDKMKNATKGNVDLVQKMHKPIYSKQEKDMLMKKLTSLTKDKKYEKLSTEEFLNMFIEEMTMATPTPELKEICEKYDRLLKVHSHILTKEETASNLKKQEMIESELEKVEEQLTEYLKECNCGLTENKYGEGWMIKSQLYNIIKSAASLYQMVEKDEDFEDWIQYKITLAEDYVITAAKFIEYRKNQEGSFYNDDLSQYNEI